MRKKEKKSSGMLSNYFYLLGFILKNEPVMLPCILLCDTAVQLPWVLSNVLLLRYIIQVFLSGENLLRILYAAVFFAAFVLLGNTVNTLYYEKVLPAQKERLQAKLYLTIYEKAAKTDLAAYDDPAFYNDFVLAMNTMGDKLENMIQLTEDLFTQLLTVGTVVGMLAVIDPICLVLIAACTGIVVPLSRLSAKVSVERTEAMTPLDRKNLYYWRVFYLADYAKELRLNPFGELFERKYNQNIDNRIRTISPFLAKQFALYFSSETIPMNLVIYFALTLYMGYQVLVRKNADPGDFAAAFNSAAVVNQSVFYLAVWFSLDFRENALYVGKFKTFMERKNQIQSGARTTVFEKTPVIRFHDVSFTYPGNSEPTLKHIDLTIEPNRKIAFVGGNGAGKTTLTHLLLRLYDVTEGSITADGIDIREWDILAWRQNFAAVFQDFSLFGATVGENIAMSDACDTEKAAEALRESGFDRDLPRGTDTVLLREFDENGLSLSGGEAQKVAIARAFYKKCAFAILDEPSANLDPEAEYQLNDAMKRASREKTVFFISHRLSTTVVADRIYMLENGGIVESGSHDELMQQNGRYAYMFKLQAEKYH